MEYSMTQERFQELLKSDEFKSFRKKVDSGKFDNIDWFNLENEIEKIADLENKSYEYHKIYEYILENKDTRLGWNDLLNSIDVLVDGRFEEEKQQDGLKFRGSTNQRIIDIKESLKFNKVMIIDL